MNHGLPDRAVEGLRSVFADFPEVECAIIYGSRAKGNYRPGSDIDLTLRGEGLNLRTLWAIEGRIDDLLLPYTVDLSLHELLTNPELREHICRVGVEFYRRVGATD